MVAAVDDAALEHQASRSGIEVLQPACIVRGNCCNRCHDVQRELRCRQPTQVDWLPVDRTTPSCMHVVGCFILGHPRPILDTTGGTVYECSCQHCGSALGAQPSLLLGTAGTRHWCSSRMPARLPLRSHWLHRRLRQLTWVRPNESQRRAPGRSRPCCSGSRHPAARRSCSAAAVPGWHRPSLPLVWATIDRDALRLSVQCRAEHICSHSVGVCHNMCYTSVCCLLLISRVLWLKSGSKTGDKQVVTGLCTSQSTATPPETSHYTVHPFFALQTRNPQLNLCSLQQSIPAS